MKILVQINEDRDRCGTLSALGDDGRPMFGPVEVAARANDSLAAENGNATRNPLFRYGDPTAGLYRVVVQDTPPANKEFGPQGLVLLMPQSGDAALAEAHGRYTLAIHGGALGPRGLLRATAGAFRLNNSDMRRLLRTLTKATETVECEARLSHFAETTRPIAVDDVLAIHDPISSGPTTWTPSRRTMLGSMAASLGVGFVGRTVTFIGATLLPTTFAEAAYNPVPEFVAGLLAGVVVAEAAPQIWSKIAPKAKQQQQQLVRNTRPVLTRLGPKPSTDTSRIVKAKLDPAVELAAGLYQAAKLFVAGDKKGAWKVASDVIRDVVPKQSLAKLNVNKLAGLLIPVTVKAGGRGALPEAAIAVATVVTTIGIARTSVLAPAKLVALATNVLHA